jgi:hypothetical protein
MKKNFQILSAICLIAVAVTSCDPNNNNNNPTPIAPDSISGYLGSQHIIVDSNIFYPAGDIEQAFAMFYSNPGSMTRVLVDSVHINGQPMDVDTDSLIYFDAGFFPPLNMSTTCSWQVFGNSVVPSFSYNYPVPYPSFTGVLPDTISKTTGVTFNLTFTGADSLFIAIPDSFGSYIVRTFSASSTSQHFTAADIASTMMSSGGLSNTLYTVSVFKSTQQVIGNKKFMFSKTLAHSHLAFVVP